MNFSFKLSTFNSLCRLLLCVGIAFNFQLSTFNSLSAQQPWNPSSVDELTAADVFLVEPPADICAAIVKAVGSPIPYNTRYHISGPFSSFFDYPYFLFTPVPSGYVNNSPVNYKIPVTLARQMLSHLVDTRYWENRFSKLLPWAYVDTERLGGLLQVDSADRRYGRYSPIRWLGYSYLPSEQSPVLFSISTNTRTPQQLTLRALERLAEWGAFATETDQLAYEQHQATLVDSLQALDSHLDYLDSQFSTVNSQLTTFIDSIAQQLRSDSIAALQEQTQAQVERTKERMNRDEIFIMNIKPARSDYMFGIELNLYNCFQRTVSMIELSVTPYNDRDRVQEDKFHRSVRTMRCMGPIHPGHPAQYTFDELFWDDRGKIKYMRVTHITFHFTDGTSKSFNGYKQILRHSLK
jgi:hypothetical protein